MRNVTLSLAAALLVAAALPSMVYAVELPKAQPAAPIATKVSAPADHQLRFGKTRPKYQSLPQTSWVCFTGGGNCFVPFLGLCTCCFNWGCYGGATG